MEQVARAINLRAAYQLYGNWMFDLACDLRVVCAKCSLSKTVVHFTHSAGTYLGIIHWNASGR